MLKWFWTIFSLDAPEMYGLYPGKDKENGP